MPDLSPEMEAWMDPQTLNRRELLAGLGLAAAVGPLLGCEQSPRPLLPPIVLATPITDARHEWTEKYYFGKHHQLALKTFRPWVGRANDRTFHGYPEGVVELMTVSIGEVVPGDPPRGFLEFRFFVRPVKQRAVKKAESADFYLPNRVSERIHEQEDDEWPFTIAVQQ